MNKAILAGAQWRLDSMLSDCGFSAYRAVCGHDPVDLFGREAGDEDLMFAQDTSLAGQFVQQLELRRKAQGATLEEIGNGGLRRFLSHNKTFNCAEIDVSDMALFYEKQNRKSSPR